MTPADLDFVAALVRAHAGVVIRADKAFFIETRLGPVARREKVPGVPALLEKLRQTPDPVLTRQVVEATLMQETSFFRDRAVFERIGAQWGGLDFLLHAIAFAPAADLHGRVVDCSAEGFALAMDVSCHSFLRMARLAEPLMPNGGCLLTVTFYGSERVVAHYNLMGPVKAALESAVRYTAAELGAKGIRAHAISPGPIKTRAASGIAHFDELLAAEAAATPERQLVDIDDVGALAAFLVSDAARRVTGTIIPVDSGQHLMA